MRFKFKHHTFHVHDQIAWLITKQAGQGTLHVNLGNNKSFAIRPTSYSLITDGNDENSKIHTVEIFGTESSVAKDHDTGDTGDTGTFGFTVGCSIYNRVTQTYTNIYDDSALSIMGAPQNGVLHLDGRQCRIDLNHLWISAKDFPSFNAVQMHVNLDRL